MKTTGLTAAALFALLFVAGDGMAATVSYRDGVDITVDGTATGIIYGATHDAELREGNPGSNFDLGSSGGAGDPQFTVDLNDGGETQVVLRFDNVFGGGAGQVPTGSIINSASLFIDIDNTGNNVELYDLSFDFGLESTVSWSSVGNGIGAGQRSAVPVATIPGNGNKVNIDVTASVAAWASNPSSNYGWVFVATGGNGVDFDTSENGDLFDRPMLTVDYTTLAPAPVPIPAGFILLLSALGAVVGVRRRTAAVSRAFS